MLLTSAVLLIGQVAVGAGTVILPPENPADPVMARVRDNIRDSNTAKAARMKCKKVRVVTDLKTGKVKRIEVFEVYSKNGVMVQKMVKQKNDADRDTKSNNERDILEDCKQCRDANKEEPLGTDLNDPAFLRKFRFTLKAQSDEDYTIDMAPEKGLEIKTHVDEAFNRLEGTFIVDANRSFIRYLKGTAKPFKKKALFITLFEMKEFKLIIEQSVIDSMILTQRILITTKYSVAGDESYEQHEILFKDFDILPPAQPVPSPTPSPLP